MHEYIEQDCQQTVNLLDTLNRLPVYIFVVAFISFRIIVLLQSHNKVRHIVDLFFSFSVCLSIRFRKENIRYIYNTYMHSFCFSLSFRIFLHIHTWLLHVSLLVFWFHIESFVIVHVCFYASNKYPFSFLISFFHENFRERIKKLRIYAYCQFLENLEKNQTFLLRSSLLSLPQIWLHVHVKFIFCDGNGYGVCVCVFVSNQHKWHREKINFSTKKANEQLTNGTRYNKWFEFERLKPSMYAACIDIYF